MRLNRCTGFILLTTTLLNDVGAIDSHFFRDCNGIETANRDKTLPRKSKFVCSLCRGIDRFTNNYSYTISTYGSRNGCKSCLICAHINSIVSLGRILQVKCLDGYCTSIFCRDLSSDIANRNFERVARLSRPFFHY